MAQASPKKERWFAAVMVLLSAGFLAQAFRYPAESAQFPRFLMMLQLLFSLVLLVQALRRPVEEGKSGFLDALATLRAPFRVFLAAALYVLAIGQLGYFVSTALFLCGSMYWFGGHRPLVLLSVAGGFLLTVYALFILFIGVRLPEGLFF